MTWASGNGGLSKMLGLILMIQPINRQEMVSLDGGLVILMINYLLVVSNNGLPMVINHDVII